ncbi:MAG: tetratricopeptide repeat protein [Myxococcaceae bacterium]|nr:tetratricopeptide repeat protein [Myxococcaceae bacterium]
MTVLVALVLFAAPHQAKLDSALALEQQGNDAQALAQVEALVAADPTWDLCRLEAARLGLKLGVGLERAGWHSDIARSLTPENPRAHYLWALTQDEAGRREEATRALEVALALRHDFPDARLRLAGLLSAQARWKEAAREWSRYLESAPQASGARLQLAQALAESGQRKAAEAELRALLRLDALRPVALRKLAELLHREGRHEEARQLEKRLSPPRRELRSLKPSAR